MAKSETIRARVEPELKREAEAVLKALGLNASEAITLFYRQVALRQGLPFEVKLPNETTRAAIRDALEGKDLTEWSDLDDGMKPEDHFQAHKAEALMWLSRIEHGLKRNAGLEYVMAQLDALRDHLNEWELTEDAAKIWVEYCDRVKARKGGSLNSAELKAAHG